ncbi:MAG: SAM-dependent methyltransferase [Dehalococcoidia bacterium]|nr:SAM-dependent methyltransferase [Dehalococcoidia bacterium]
MIEQPSPSNRPGISRFFARGNPALLEIIRGLIRRDGKITFADFMDLALYHPDFGYYNSARERFGKQGDFFTGPETHPVFGALIACQLEQMWQSLDRPRSFAVVEMGAGAGALCRDVLTYARSSYPALFSAISYKLVESSAVSVQRQRALLRASHLPLRSIRWYPSLSLLPRRPIVGCFLSNELVDAFPFHRVINDRGEIKEIYVGLAGDELVDVVDRPSTPAIVDHFQWVGTDLPIGCQAEVNLRSVDWIREVGRRLQRGFVLTIDYGYPAADLYSSVRPRGTLLCYYKHSYLEDPYVRVGQQDITAHIDFTALARAGEEEGLAPISLTSQRDFLISLGLPAFVSELKQKGLGAAEYRANFLALEELANPNGLGRLKVLLQSK